MSTGNAVPSLPHQHHSVTASSVFNIYTIYQWLFCPLQPSSEQSRGKERHVPYRTAVGNKDSHIVHRLVRGHLSPPVLIYATETLFYS